MQGMSKLDSLWMDSNTATKATGNAYPATLLGAMLAPLHGCIGEMSAEDQVSWPPVELATGRVGSVASKFRIPMNRPRPKSAGPKSKAMKA